jgi:hypothetical protein
MNTSVLGTSGYLEDGWVRSTFCGPNGQNCVEVNHGVRARVGVRDSKSGNVLAVDRDRWSWFLRQVTR